MDSWINFVNLVPNLEVTSNRGIDTARLVKTAGSKKLLASSLACSRWVGSESLVGFYAVETLSSHYDTSLITAAGMEQPGVDRLDEIPVHFDDANDVSSWQLMQFEWRQRKFVDRLLRNEHFDIVHRVTPSGLKDSLLPVPYVPLVLGPILLTEPHPSSFREIFCPKLPTEWSMRATVKRIQNGVARRVFRHWSTLNKLLEQAAMILVGTRTTLRQLPAALHPRCRLLTYAGVEHELFRPARSKLPNRVPQVLFVGRVVPYKGVELLLRAAALARESCRFELTIVGAGNAKYRSFCITLAAALGLSNTVKFVENQPRARLAEMYRSADVFCMPSIETYGVAILEAMSSGCAVLVSDINGPGEIVEGNAGVKVPLESPEQFIRDYSAQLVSLLEDSRWREELGERARERAVTHHDWQRIQAELADVYADLLSESGSTRYQASPSIAAIST